MGRAFASCATLYYATCKKRKLETGKHDVAVTIASYVDGNASSPGILLSLCFSFCFFSLSLWVTLRFLLVLDWLRSVLIELQISNAQK